MILSVPRQVRADLRLSAYEADMTMSQMVILLLETVPREMRLLLMDQARKRGCTTREALARLIDSQGKFIQR